ncbi:MAG: hypothetical protein GY953_38695, partial [bacterium]|nr:hypothetical protein [bacterium]
AELRRVVDEYRALAGDIHADFREQANAKLTDQQHALLEDTIRGGNKVVGPETRTSWRVQSRPLLAAAATLVICVGLLSLYRAEKDAPVQTEIPVDPPATEPGQPVLPAPDPSPSPMPVEPGPTDVRSGGLMAVKRELPRPLFGGTPKDLRSSNLEPPGRTGKRRLMVPRGTTQVALGKVVTS